MDIKITDTTDLDDKQEPTVFNEIIEQMVKDKNSTERIATLPEYHDKKKFDALFKLAKLEYPDELDYIIHLGLLASLLEEDEMIK
jgi:hypothetical protein